MNTPVTFGRFEADPRSGELRRDGEVVRLQEQPFRLLVLLAERPGEVVTRDEIRAALWSADEYVEFEHSLNTAVNRLRTALGDSASEPQYIETVPRRGYRFIGVIEGASASSLQPRPDRDRTRWWRIAAVAGAVALLVTAALKLWDRRDGPEGTGLIAVAPPVPLTSFPGEELSPTFSPDGNQVAFARREAGASDFDIWILTVGDSTARELTGGSAADFNPSYSRDGQWIYFSSSRSGEFEVWKTPVSGEGLESGETVPVTTNGGYGPQESPDGRYIYYSSYGGKPAAHGRKNSLWRMLVGGGSEGNVLAEFNSNWGNWAFVGEPIYFIDCIEGEGGETGWALYKLDPDGGERELVTMLPLEPFVNGPGLDVAADGSWILMTATNSGESDLMLVEGFY